MPWLMAFPATDDVQGTFRDGAIHSANIQSACARCDSKFLRGTKLITIIPKADGFDSRCGVNQGLLCILLCPINGTVYRALII